MTKEINIAYRINGKRLAGWGYFDEVEAVYAAKNEEGARKLAEKLDRIIVKKISFVQETNLPEGRRLYYKQG